MNMNLKKIYKKRNPWAHKGQFGYILIIAGSQYYTGSPIFNAMCALRSGADLVTLATPKRAADIAASFYPDIITHPLDFEFSGKHLPKILDLAKGFDCLVMGGGLARTKTTYSAIKEAIKKIYLPMVLDAEAIRSVAEKPEILQNKQAVLTPNSKEFEVLSGQKIKPEISDRKTKVKNLAKKLNVTILLKGSIDVISDGEKVVLNKTGTPFMTKGGFGDCLAGICGSMLGRGLKPLVAAQAAAYINGRAGELASKKFGESVLASDIFDFIPLVIKKAT